MGDTFKAELEALRQRSLKAKWRETIGDMEVPSDEELKAMQKRGEMPSDEELALAAAERAVIDTSLAYGGVTAGHDPKKFEAWLYATTRLISLRAAQEKVS